MPICKSCHEQVDEVQTVTVAGRNKKLCEDCAAEAADAEALGEAAESAMQGMMEYKGR